MKYEGWQLEFINSCTVMMNNGNNLLQVKPRGEIRYTDQQCNICGSNGIYLGNNLECGKLFPQLFAEIVKN